MARFMRTDLGKAHSRLSPPAVITEAEVVLAPPIQVALARFTPPARIHSRLGFPVVAAEEPLFVIYAEPMRRLFRRWVYSNLRGSILRPPQVVQHVAPPPIISDENLAPIIYGYGAM